MRNIILRLYATVAILIVLGGLYCAITDIVKAQTVAPWQVGVNSATHTSCTVVANTTEYCFASDGLWVSLSGAAYVQVQLGAVAAGVTSWNGLTGAVTYAPAPAPVTSVNGKTGAVVISAVATAPTVSLQ